MLYGNHINIVRRNEMFDSGRELQQFLDDTLLRSSSFVMTKTVILLKDDTVINIGDITSVGIQDNKKKVIYGLLPATGVIGLFMTIYDIVKHGGTANPDKGDLLFSIGTFLVIFLFIGFL